MRFESPTYDKLLFVAGTHGVMYDRLQIVIQHPYECPHKGAGMDKRKTFHHLQGALQQLERCDVTLTTDQQLQLRGKGEEVARAPRN